MDRREALITLKAIEFMSYGVDISKLTTVDDYKGYINVQTKEMISRLSPNVLNFVWKLDAESVELLDFFSEYVVRDGKTFKNLSEESEEVKNVNIEVTKDMLISTMKVLYAAKVCSYLDVDPEILDDDLQRRLKEIDDAFDRLQTPSSEMITKLTKENTKRNFGILTALAYKCKPEIRDLMLNSYDKVYTSFNLNNLKDFKVIDNRLYIPLSEADWHRIKQYFRQKGWTWDSYNEDMKYIVVSKNLYDYYFCSYGSEFQSCYSLTSDYKGWWGMLPYGTFDSHYIIYGAKETINKVTITQDNNKWIAPYMYFRCWGWTSKDGDLLVDKPYTNRHNLYEALRDTFLHKFMRLEVNTSTDTLEASDMVDFFIKNNLGFYPDSVNVSSFKFKFTCGNRSYVGSGPGYGNSFYNMYLARITSITDSFDPRKDFDIVNGKLLNPKKCPLTGFLIEESESSSVYAKYLNAPVDNGMLVVTYCDGAFKMDASSKETRRGSVTVYETASSVSCYDSSTIALTKNFSPCSGKIMSLKTFKERLKGGIHSSDFDLILLRVIEGDKVTYIKYKKHGVKA